MNKTRLENLSDGVFAIIFTILVLELRVPEVAHLKNNAELWHELAELTPIFLSYCVSFVVLAMFWISHTALYSLIVKNMNRQLVLINMVYLALASLIPFTSHLMGRYIELPLAVQLYGLNILGLGLVAVLAFQYALRSKELDTEHVTKRMVAQASIRGFMTPLFTLLGILAATFSIPLALFLFAFPIMFNVIPGTLDKLERALGLDLGNN